MRAAVAALFAAYVFTALSPAPATAAATAVNVRIEGESETLFEGPILAEPHGVRATSDPIAPRIRRCDATNPLNPEGAPGPAPTPTAVSADAMSLIGQSFDGRYYDELEDYFLTRWGPDSQSPGTAAYWGILVNNVFTAVGGCQYALDDEDEVLWVYDSFKGRPTLALFPESPNYGSGLRPLTAEATLHQPFDVEVVSYADDAESKPPPTPGRTGASGFSGATISPVLTGSKPASQGFQRVETTSVLATTGPAGKASIEFTTPGWHRIKATVGAPGGESVIRSNRLDVCVEGAGGAPLEGAVECGELPAADQPRTPAPTVGEIEEAHRKQSPQRPGGNQGQRPGPPGVAGAIRVTSPSLNRRNLRQGRLGVRWRLLDAGPGVKEWTIASKTLSPKGAHYVTRAAGTRETSALVRLPRGHSYRLRFTVTDLLDRSSTLSLGKVTVPDARHR